jgi:predicted esterase
LSIKAPVALIEVANDTVVTKYHFDKLKENIQNLALHVTLQDTTHGDVLNHPDFEKSIEEILKKF